MYNNLCVILNNNNTYNDMVNNTISIEMYRPFTKMPIRQVFFVFLRLIIILYTVNADCSG